MKKNKYIILSFLVPFVLFFFALLCNIYIIRKSIVFGDLRAQYLPFFNYYKNIFTGKESILYSFSNGIGSNMIGTISYYLTSPLNLIILLFSTKNLPIGITILIAIKLSLSGLTMFLYLKNTFKDKNQKYILMFSTCYALTMYFCEYFINIMWFDCIYLLPLILLGINKIVENKSSKLYFIFLFLAIFSNYYIGYMVCIFSVIYFIYLIILKYQKIKKDLKKIIIKFIITSILSGLCCSILLIPTFYQLLNTSKTATKITSLKFNLNILKTINNLFIGRHNNIPYNDTPLLYCGIIILVLNLLYFQNKAINKKEKILDLIIIVFFFLSFSVNILNYVWHGFAFPNGYIYRNLFFLTFFVIIIAYKSFLKIKTVEYKNYYITAFIITMLVVIVQIPSKFSNIDKTGIISVLMSIIYLTCLYVIFKNKNVEKKDKKLIGNLLIIIVCLESAFNFYIHLSLYLAYQNKEYTDYYEVFSSNINKIKDSSIYRIHSGYNKENESFLFNIKTLNSFDSNLSKQTFNFYKRLGLVSTEHAIYYDEARNSFTDSILGVKYLILKNKDDNYKKINQFKFCKYSGEFYLEEAPKQDYYIYKNNNALSLGFMINDAVFDKNNQKVSNSFYGYDYQNYMYLTMSEDINNQLFEMIDVKEKKSKNKYIYTTKIKNKKDIYMYSKVNFLDSEAKIKIYINDNEFEYMGYDFSALKISNNLEIGDKLKVVVEPSKKSQIQISPRFYNYNENLINNLYQKLSKNELKITSFKNSKIKGVVTSKKNKNILFTSIPYDEGWTVKVDNKKVKTYKLYEEFLGVKLKEGKHTIEFSYFPKGLKLGITISSIALLLTIVYFKRKK